MNGTENTESGKVVKTLYMHLNEFLIIKDGLLTYQEEDPGTFVTRIEEGHLYDILIETFDFKTRTIRNNKRTAPNKKVTKKHIGRVDMYIKDFTEHVGIATYPADHTILRIFADGTDPNIWRTIQIVDVTEEDHSTCVANDSDDANENHTDDTINVSQTDNTDAQEQVISDNSNTCDCDPKEDIKKLLDDVKELEGKISNLVDRSAVIKYYIERHSNSIEYHILQKEVGLLNTYLSSINTVYGNNLDRVTLNIKNTLDI